MQFQILQQPCIIINKNFIQIFFSGGAEGGMAKFNPFARRPTLI